MATCNKSLTSVRQSYKILSNNGFKCTAVDIIILYVLKVDVSNSVCDLTWTFVLSGGMQSPTLGAHAHVHPCPWVLGGHGCDVIVHGWAWVGIGFVHPCIQLQIGVKLLGCKEYANQKALRAEASDNE
jgi:hypothetical protein